MEIMIEIENRDIDAQKIKNKHPKLTAQTFKNPQNKQIQSPLSIQISEIEIMI